MQRQSPFVVGEYYHVYNRGVDKRIIFESTQDYKRFIILLYLCNSVKPIRLDNLLRFKDKSYNQILNHERDERLVSIGVWCLMPNHFHLVLKEQVSNGISTFMRKLGTGYSMYFNSKNNRKGTLFSGPFRSKNISEDNYMQHLFGYIHLNPLDLEISDWEEDIKKNKNLTDKAIDILSGYTYSSYQDYLGSGRVENRLLDREQFPEYFTEQNSFKDFIKRYLTFI